MRGANAGAALRADEMREQEGGEEQRDPGVGDESDGFVAVAAGVADVQRRGEAVKHHAVKGDGEDEAGPDEARNADDAGRDIGEAELGDELQGAGVGGAEDGLGGEARLRDLPDARREQPHADGPEYEPAPEQGPELERRLRQQRLDEHRGDGQDEHEGENDGVIHGEAPMRFVARARGGRKDGDRGRTVRLGWGSASRTPTRPCVPVAAVRQGIDSDCRSAVALRRTRCRPRQSLH